MEKSKMKRTFYFNTGVVPESDSKLYGRQVWKGGVKQIPFTCEDVPDGAEFLFACDNDHLSESKIPGVTVHKILDSGPGGLLSKYAYFRGVVK
jgi:hypothetical protein